MTRYLAFFFLWIATQTSVAQTLVRALGDVSEYRLANGLQVLLAPNDLHTRVYVNMTVKVGSAHEGNGEGGMAHLLEHLVFKGTPTTKDPLAEFDKRSFSSNGTTNLDRTNYFASMNATSVASQAAKERENLHWFIGWLADALVNSHIAKADLDKEMSVVRNEFERSAGSAYSNMNRMQMALTFPSHPYGRPVIGNLSDIENVPIDRLQAFYKTWYRPDNTVLVVSGKFNKDEVLAHIQSTFGTLTKPTTPLPKSYTQEAVQDGERGASIRRFGGTINTLISWRTVPLTHLDHAPLDVVAYALTNRAQGRFSTAAERQALGTNPYAYNTGFVQYGLFVVGIQLKDNEKVEPVTQLLTSTIRQLASTGVNESELQSAKLQLQQQFEESRLTPNAWGSALAEHAVLGDWRSVYWWREQLDKVTTADTKRVAAQYLVPSNRVRVSYFPTPEPVRAPQTPAQDLSTYQPSASVVTPPKTRSAQLVKFEATAAEIEQRLIKFDLPVGTKVQLLARPAAGDEIQGTLRLHWASMHSLKTYASSNNLSILQLQLRSFAASMLIRGTALRSQKQLEDDLNAWQSTVNVSSSVSGLTLNFKTTAQHWAAFSGLLRELLHEPGFMQAGFDTKLFDTWKAQNIASIHASLDNPNAMAARAMNRLFYAFPADDPRHTAEPLTQIAAWEKLSLDDLRSFWRDFVGASHSEFAAVGALDTHGVQTGIAAALQGFDTPIAHRRFERLPYPLPHSLPKPNSQAQTIATPDKPNANLLMRRYVSMKDDTPQFYALGVVARVLGSDNTARLFTTLRKDEGLTYGTYAWSSYTEEDEVGALNVSGSYAPQNRDRFVAGVHAVMQALVDKGVSAQELQSDIEKNESSRITSRNNDASMASVLASNAYYGRNMAYWDRRAAQLKNLKLEDVNAAAKAFFNPSDFVTIITGDFK